MNKIDTLQSLTQTTYDSVEGYRKAIDTANSPAIKSALQNRLNSRERTLETLNSALEANGGKRVTSTSATASAHQMFMSIADAFEDSDENAIERVEEGEDYIVGQFKDALEDNVVDTALRSVIETAYQDVRSGERFSDMMEKQYA